MSYSRIAKRAGFFLKDDMDCMRDIRAIKTIRNSMMQGGTATTDLVQERAKDAIREFLGWTSTEYNMKAKFR